MSEPHAPLTATLQGHLNRSLGYGSAAHLNAARSTLLALLALCAAITTPALLAGDLVAGDLVAGVLVVSVVTISEALLNERWRGARREAMHPGVAVLTIALILRPGTWVILAMAASALVMTLWWRRDPLGSVWIVARTAAQTTAALWLSQLITVPILNASLAVFVMWLAGAFTVTLTSPLQGEGGESLPTWARAAYNTALTVSVAAVSVFLIQQDWRWAASVALLVAAVVREYTAHRADIVEAEMFQALLSYVHGRDQHGLRPAAELTLFAMETAFASARTDVTLTLLDEVDPWRLTRDPRGAITHSSAPMLTTASRDLLRLGTGAISTHSTARGASFTAVLGEPGLPLALVEVRWTGMPARDRRQRERLGKRMATLAGAWLASAHARERAELAEAHTQTASGESAGLANLSDRTRPALESLRQATRQVAVLSQSHRPEHPRHVAGIVDELDRAAVAVATLLGAVTASSDRTDDELLFEPAQMTGAVSAPPEGPRSSVPFGTLEVVAHAADA